jgi:hypothetical protein
MGRLFFFQTGIFFLFHIFKSNESLTIKSLQKMKRKFTSIAKAASMPAFVFAVLLFSSCNKNESEDLQMTNQTKSLSTATRGDQPTGTPEVAMIQISHGACMGRCPNYTVSVSRNGDVAYYGIANVSMKGTVNYSISPDVAYQLGNMMEQDGFFNLANQYALVPDAQRFETSLVWNGKIKSVVDCGVHVPEQLLRMREKVEKAIDIDRLINGTSVSPGLQPTQ